MHIKNENGLVSVRDTELNRIRELALDDLREGRDIVAPYSAVAMNLGRLGGLSKSGSWEEYVAVGIYLATICEAGWDPQAIAAAVSSQAAGDCA